MEQLLKDAGPFSAPLCAFMALFGGAVIRWLLKKQDQILVELREAREDAKQLREQRLGDSNARAEEYQRYSDALRAELTAVRSDVAVFNERARAVLDRREGS